MKARPILFSGPMVRALLEGRKTQTRRVVKPSVKGCTVGAYTGGIGGTQPVNVQEDGDPWTDIPCPFGKPGDLLWVRETWGRFSGPGISCCASSEPHVVSKSGGFEPVLHRAGKEDYAWGLYGPPDWKPSIHMPRTASRLTLLIKAIRVERLNDISDSDAKAEGYFGEMTAYEGPGIQFHHAEAFLSGEWASPLRASNPWVWVVEFDVIKANVDQVLREVA